MRQTLVHIILSVVLLAICIGCDKKQEDNSNKLVILHFNDTHSQIDPAENGLGGVLRRMGAIDSIRAIYPNVMLLDAGDDVQGTLYFYLYGGQVEQEVLNLMGIDAGILGNHEFDNGIDSLAAILALRNSPMISSNYIMEGTALEGRFVPFVIKETAGKKIGILGINLNPDGMISPDNCVGLQFLPEIATANLVADSLRNSLGVDLVVALTHIGYDPAGLVGDSILALNSRNIDIIIGGHSHDTIDPATEEGARRSRLTNLEGEPVLVVQTGKAGRYLGKIEINLDSLGLSAPAYELIKIDNRFDGYRNEDFERLTAPYRAGVDSLMHLWISNADHPMPASENELLNLFTDFVYERGDTLLPGIDLAIANKGALRTDIHQGPISKGQIINLLPFRNRITVLELNGSDLIDIFNVMARTAGNGISSNVSASYRPTNEGNILGSVKINGQPINPSRKYKVATIDYLAKGGDYMRGFLAGETLATSEYILYDELIEYLTAENAAGRNLSGAAEARWTVME